jgi:hypothetical protein
MISVFLCVYRLYVHTCMRCYLYLKLKVEIIVVVLFIACIAILVI